MKPTKAALSLALAALLLSACGKDPAPSPAGPPGAAETADAPSDPPTTAPSTAPDRSHLTSRGEILTAGASVQELEAARAEWQPSLPPDKLDVVPAPGADVMDPDKQNKVVVTAGELRFSAAEHPDVATWEKGRVIVSGPADPGSPGKNPFGFARKVDKVEQVGDTLVVTTTAAALQEIMHGELQLEFDTATAREVEWQDFEQSAEWAAAKLYVSGLPDTAHYPGRLRDDATPAAKPSTQGGGDPGGDPWGCCVPSFISDAVDFVGDKIGAAKNAVVNTAKKAGSAVASGAKAVGNAVASGAKAAGKVIIEAGKVIGRAVGSAATQTTQTVSSIGSAIAKAAVTLYEAVMPKSFEGEATLDPEFEFDDIDLPIVNYNLKKGINESGDFPMEVSFSADANLTGLLNFAPKISLGAEIPNPLAIGELPPLRTWLDVSAALTASLTLDVSLKASLTSAGGKAGSKLEEQLGVAGELAGTILNKYRKEVLGNKDTKPAGNWKKTVFLSKPKVQVIPLGKLPVVLVGTFQVDIDCGFELKAELNAQATAVSVHTFTYRAEYVQGVGIKQQTPTYKHTPRTEVWVLGGGEASLACSVIPRINVFLYDTIGLNAGFRGSLIASATYESTCAPNKTAPDGEVELALKVGIGVPVGARLQVPGSSWGGKEALDSGVELGPLEIWNTEFKLLDKSWDVPGLGYCTPTCSNGRKGDKEKETDLDCGGECPTGCALGKMCKVNSDCASGLFCVGGVCGDSHCGDGVLSGDEAGIDCGGATCDKCSNGSRCRVAGDCASGSCKPGSVDLGFVKVKVDGVCHADACTDGVRSAGECGVDCGGPCGPCPLGAQCSDAKQCASGQTNGYQCAVACTNLKKDGGETDVDCGGATGCDRCAAGKRCASASDCMASAPLCTGGVCAAAPPRCGGFGEACCASGNQCGPGLMCNGTTCQCPADKGIACGQSCCGAGQMCNAGQCVDPAPSCLSFPTEVRETCAPGQCLPSCRAILAARPGAQSGIYTIEPDPAAAPFPVRCDMSLDGGGWTLVGFESAGQPAAQATGMLASLFEVTGSADAVATGTGPGLIGPRFSFAKGHYSHLRLNWCDPSAPQNHYQSFRTSEEIFADAERAANGTIELSEFQSNDPVLNQQIPTPDSARFCRARTSTLFPGDTSWGVKGKDELNFACGCNSGSWTGVGSYYGGTGQKCTKCSCFGGGWAGTAGNGVQKGAINKHTFYLWIR